MIRRSVSEGAIQIIPKIVAGNFGAIPLERNFIARQRDGLHEWKGLRRGWFGGVGKTQREENACRKDGAGAGGACIWGSKHKSVVE